MKDTGHGYQSTLRYNLLIGEGKKIEEDLKFVGRPSVYDNHLSCDSLKTKNKMKKRYVVKARWVSSQHWWIWCLCPIVLQPRLRNNGTMKKQISFIRRTNRSRRFVSPANTPSTSVVNRLMDRSLQQQRSWQMRCKSRTTTDDRTTPTAQTLKCGVSVYNEWN